MRNQFLLVFYLLLLTCSIKSNASNSDQETKNDSLTLAQSYINLSLTQTYFDSLTNVITPERNQRIFKILSFEEQELASLKDKKFITNNSTLYNFTYSLLYFIEAKLAYKVDSKINRSILVQWFNLLDKSIKHFNAVKYHGIYSNDFFELINFNIKAFNNLNSNILDLKTVFTPYFNNDIYPDYQRLFYEAKNENHFYLDSLKYYAGIFNITLNPSLLDTSRDYYSQFTNLNNEKEVVHPYYNQYDIDEPIEIRDAVIKEFDSQEFRLDKNNPISTTYKMNLSHQYISKYLTLFAFAKNEHPNKYDLTKMFGLFNSYWNFLLELNPDDSVHYSLRNADSLTLKDAFISKELNTATFVSLFNLLQAQSNDSILLAQAFINLWLNETYSDSISSAIVNNAVQVEERGLNSIKDSLSFRALYNFSNSLLYYSKAKILYKNRKEIKRSYLLQCKNTLEESINYFDQTDQDQISKTNSFYKAVKFDVTEYFGLENKIKYQKLKFEPYFNRDIYADYKIIFYAAKETGHYYFDSLSYYASIYNFQLSFDVLSNSNYKTNNTHTKPISKNNQYHLDLSLDLISRYLQLKFLLEADSASGIVTTDGCELQKSLDNFGDDLNPADSKYFIDSLATYISKDSFFNKELNKDAYEKLWKLFEERFQACLGTGHQVDSNGKSLDGVPDYKDSILNTSIGYLNLHFFPNPAPRPSASKTILNYKPELKVLGQVDNFLSNILFKAGYNKHLHYYYALDGFAIATGLERFKIDGPQVSDDKRWVKHLGESGKLSYYEVFKSMFFDTESEARFFAFIVASKKVTISNVKMSAGKAEEILKDENSYPSLPAELKNKTLPNKNLTVLVYHFHQNDIGTTVELDVSNKIKTEEHLLNAGLIEIIK